MLWTDSAVAARFVLLTSGVAGTALRFWRRTPRTSGDPEVDLKSQLACKRFPGFLNLVLENRSRMKLWVVDVTIEFSELRAQYQTCAPTRNQTVKIRQVIEPREGLRTSCIEVFYNGAGRPQEEYAFVVSARTRYRAHGDLFEQVLRPCRVRMIALSPLAARRMRWYEKPAQPERLAGALPQLEPADLNWLELGPPAAFGRDFDEPG
jgi:hypothetical protein